jgi:hypothetical protein
LSTLQPAGQQPSLTSAPEHAVVVCATQRAVHTLASPMSM